VQDDFEQKPDKVSHGTTSTNDDNRSSTIFFYDNATHSQQNYYQPTMACPGGNDESCFLGGSMGGRVNPFAPAEEDETFFRQSPRVTSALRRGGGWKDWKPEEEIENILMR
jgi:hypothetical protein